MKTFLDHVQLNVADADRSLPFYRALLDYLEYRVLHEERDLLGATNGTTDLWLIETPRERAGAACHRQNAARRTAPPVSVTSPARRGSMGYSVAVNAPSISAADPYERRRVPVLDSEMAYVDVGQGAPIVFLHGNPTSSYLWRNVIPHVRAHGRCLAPDLIGMGASGPAAGGAYRFADHARYLDAWLDALELRDVTLVVHDWGSALGFHWAARNPARVKALAYMEAIVRPVTWAEWPDNARAIFQGMRSPSGETIILEKNVFVERILPGSVLRRLGEDEMRAYRGPWLTAGEERRPMLTWPRELPIDGEPADVVEVVEGYARWLATTTTPKLFVNAEPGSILVGAQREFCRAWPNQREVTVRGSHFLQEDSPAEIGEALARFLEDIR